METRELIEYIKKVKEEKEKFENSMKQIMKEKEEFKAEADSKKDKNSGFYKDAITKAKEKHKEWTEVFNKKENYIEEQNKEIQKKKVQKIKELKEKAQWLDENRNKSAEEIYTEIKELNSSLYAKKQELKYYESTLAESDVSKKGILENKREYISKLNVEIKDKINKAELLKDGKAEQHFNEIQDEIEIINNVTIDNVEEYLAKESKKSENKAQQPQTQPNQPQTQPGQPQTQPNQPQTQPSQPQTQPKQPQTQPKQPQTQPNQPQTQQKQPQTQPNQPQTQPNQSQTQQSQPKTQPNQPQSQEDEDVVFNDGGKDKKGKKIKKIEIVAAEKTAYIYSEPNDEKRGYSIQDTIALRKGPQYKDNINKMLDSIETKSPIKRALLRRKINPIIVRAISGDTELMKDYIKALRDKTQFPFEYYINLNNSTLSKKDFNIMNRIALKEAQIKENNVEGTKKKFTKIKNAFAKIKNTKLFSRKEKTKELTEGKNTPNPDTKSRKKIFDDSIKMTDEKMKQLKEEREQATEAAYSKLTDEQKKKNLFDKSISELQGMGLTYNEAYYIHENEKKNKQQPANQGQTQESEQTR